MTPRFGPKQLDDKWKPWSPSILMDGRTDVLPGSEHPQHTPHVCSIRPMVPTILSLPTPSPPPPPPPAKRAWEPTALPLLLPQPAGSLPL